MIRDVMSSLRTLRPVMSVLRWVLFYGLVWFSHEPFVVYRVPFHMPLPSRVETSFQQRRIRRV